MSNTPNQKRRRAERARDFLEVLIDRHPNALSRERDHVRPLAIGIQEALRADLDADGELDETPNWLLKQALARYTHSPAYLEAIIAGHRRVGLDGADAGAVTEEAVAHARTRRDEQKARAAERRRQARKSRKRGDGQQNVQERKLQRLADKFNSR
ncbi:RNA chaperone ProQ [wastewater metagenome]|uniref:RNA chaperone ProQ n=2 Tax=unclassified sequences TaxID=12908 RepID=A0A5B8R792_9ZZZZ|nr:MULTISPECIES: ProQ/FINO family protein [Arhodomonas]MCS4502671.1 ProQ/FinO family protein [Arhodomonas aquaeolei]QEA03848.1 RNA chaperone ProQ [uncultured organism]